jgi:glyoxylase-like metal-dependent hydrolase (beta-lactamase superfamily II)
LLKAKDGYVLIDTGLPSQWEMLESQLLSAGCLPDKLKLIVITHGDWDHTGNAQRLRDKYKVKIAMHAGDVPQVETGTRLKRSVRPFPYKVTFYFRMLMKKLKGQKMEILKFKPDILLTDGQSLEVFGAAAKIVHIPGHTPGSIAVLTAEGSLIAGDMFVNRKKPDSAQIIENSIELKNSQDRLQTMNIKIIYPGHGKPFKAEDFKGAF